jgi:hypothetical protein
MQAAGWRGRWDAVAAPRDRALWQASVLGLVALRLGMWWLLQHDIPRMTEHYQWRFYHGGDESLYVQLAQEILENNVRWHYREDIPVTVGVGLPLMFAGLMKFSNSYDYEAFLPLVVIGNGVFLGLLSVVVMAQLAKVLTGSRLLAVWVGAGWTLLPYLLWVGFGIHPQADRLRNAYVSRQMWVSGITDGPSFLFVILGVLLALWGLRAVRRGQAAQAALLVAGGACMGVGMTLRIHVLPIAAVVVAALLASRRWQAAGWVVAGMLLGFGPQFWHNTLANGHPLNTPYFHGWIAFSPPNRLIDPMIRDGWRFLGPNHAFAIRFGGAPFSPGFLVENIAGLIRRLPLLVVAALVTAAIGAYAFARCWQARGRAAAIIMFGAPVGSFAIHVVTFVYAADPVRFTLPAVSIGLPAVVWTGAILFDRLARTVRRPARSASQ